MNEIVSIDRLNFISILHCKNNINETYTSCANFYIKKPNSYSVPVKGLSKIMANNIDVNCSVVSKIDYLM